MPYTPPGYDPGTSGGVVLPPVPVSGGVYWDPGFWDAGWYDPRWWPGVAGVLVAAPQIGRDQVALQAIADLLTATGEFEAVTFGTPDTSARYPATDAPVANLRRTRATQRPDANPTMTVRTVSYEITATVRVRDREDAEAELDRLDSVVLDAVSLKDYGFCLPAKSIVEAGHFITDTYPPTKIQWNGTFTYVTNSSVGRDKRELAWNP